VTSDLVKPVLSQKLAHSVAENSFSNINSANHLFEISMNMKLFKRFKNI